MVKNVVIVFGGGVIDMELSKYLCNYVCMVVGKF